MIFGRRYGLHRLVWLAAHGVFPENDIDHINGLTEDNRLENLRLATRGQNLANRRHLQANNRSGARGVYWSRQKCKWHARITQNGKAKHIGFYPDISAARAAFDAAARKAFGEFYQPIQSAQ